MANLPMGFNSSSRGVGLNPAMSWLLSEARTQHWVSGLGMGGMIPGLCWKMFLVQQAKAVTLAGGYYGQKKLLAFCGWAGCSCGGNGQKNEQGLVHPPQFSIAQSTVSVWSLWQM